MRRIAKPHSEESLCDRQPGFTPASRSRFRRRAMLFSIFHSGRFCREPECVRSGRSAAWLARLVRDQEAGGSNPLAPTILFKEIPSTPGLSITALWAILRWSNLHNAGLDGPVRIRAAISSNPISFSYRSMTPRNCGACLPILRDWHAPRWLALKSADSEARAFVDDQFAGRELA